MSENCKRKLNEKKTNIIIINFTSNYQFETSLKLKSTNIEHVKETKIFGTIVSDNLLWDRNCAKIF